MAYISALQLLAWPGVSELAQCASPDDRAQVDTALLTAVITGASTASWSAEELAAANAALVVIDLIADQASNEVDSYVYLRAVTIPLPLPQILSTWATKIARYMLHKNLRIGSESGDGLHPIHRDYNDAIKSLRDYRDGKQGLGIPSALDPNAPLQDNSVQFTSQATVWGRR